MRFETRYTYDFIKRFLPPECRRILEVGCGTGELAAHLTHDGYAVIAIDSDRDSVAAARRLDVDARVATWPKFDEGHFDAVLFIRSLHHIHPLDESVRHSADSLVEGGLIIVEDFAYESTDEKTLRWFSSAIRLIEATGLLIVSDDFQHRVSQKRRHLKRGDKVTSKNYTPPPRSMRTLKRCHAASLERAQRTIFGISPARSLRWRNAMRSFRLSRNKK